MELEITTAYARKMADYNRWMNDGIYAAAASLSDEQRREDVGAFFRSIHETLNHYCGAINLDEPICRHAASVVSGYSGKC